MKRYTWIAFILIVLILTPLALWFVQKEKTLNIMLFDYTVGKDEREHAGTTWLLNHLKIRKESGEDYKYTDYINRYDGTQGAAMLKQAEQADVLLFTDTYGENYSVNGKKEHRGGLTSEDVELATDAISKGKTVVAEFNTAASPTPSDRSKSFHQLFGTAWTGWIGRFFPDLKELQGLDPTVEEKLMVQAKEKTFKLSGPGYVFINDSTGEAFFVNDDTPLLYKWDQQQTAAKDEVRYNYWFEVLELEGGEQQAHFSWKPSKQTQAMLRARQLPLEFPAYVTQGSAHYFAGDYTDVADIPRYYRYSGLEWFRKQFILDGAESETAFFWKVYAPTLHHILESTKSVQQVAVKTKPLAATTINDQTLRTRAREGQDTLEMYQDGKWKPYFVKGVNVGLGRPGAFPGEHAISRNEYDRWLKQMGEMEVNTIRIYTLHPPAFYDALKAYNETAKKPIYLMQGMWVEEKPFEELKNAYNPEFLKMTDTEAKRMVDVIHGNAVVKEVVGHASGTYTSDVSQYVSAFVFGIEWLPEAVVETNKKNKGTRFEGNYVTTTKDASPFESWLAGRMDTATAYEVNQYKTTRPIGSTNWPTTDPLSHPNEAEEEQDLVSLDFNHLKATKNFAGGLFASYHIYPYYPSFIKEEFGKKTDTSSESYRRYLKKINTYHEMPILVSEFGIPSSRGKTHLGPNGFDQGHVSEEKQGELVANLYQDIVDTKMAGGLVFIWQDEWFKRTWNTMDYDDANTRPRWSNVQTSEQHFGMLGFLRSDIVIDGKMDDWDGYAPIAQNEQQAIYMTSDEAYLYLRIDRKKVEPTTVALSTKPNDGNQRVGDMTLEEGAEYRLTIDKKARIDVDERYDIFRYHYGLKMPFEMVAPPSDEKNSGNFNPIYQMLDYARRDPVTKKIVKPAVKWDTGVLHEGSADSILTDISDLTKPTIELRIPWMVLNMRDPSKHEIIGDFWKEGLEAKMVTEGIEVTGQVGTTRIPEVNRGFYSWSEWTSPQQKEQLKPIYETMRQAFSKGVE
ncbi:hypothetical protein [Exiguobacterium sp. s193]|uniref:hypothetical protein n=1 Tax=Exiguobacterium sp. s193 TaxID=2751207 RepID=UPI003337A8F3